MSASSALPLRIWRLRPWATNPLMRFSDRCESSVRIVAVAIALAAVPLAGAAGTVSYTETAERLAVQNAGKIEVPATLVGDPHPAAAASRADTGRFEATVRWEYDGRSGTTTVPVTGGLRAGERTSAWLTADGTPTDSPQRAGTAAEAGIGTGAAVLLITWSAAAALAAGTGCALDARRRAAWEAEWRGMTRPIGRDLE
ncbi:Probable membrane protein Rv1733c/MT1774 [Nocardia otitidiscaviarum]|uniref:Probable membrane protein Rv1733c/MT1774 n=1 Tax=Nocardia otitidiscaviarum TaxID=1823 RepID=A0A379JL88_9NOCA|nr:hypothetical protein [Nocardia otitidiscaviarum]SUD49372.1 Probable membrane protein Rv1733c/MT1774 [Nocardia otitidiscaviarum]